MPLGHTALCKLSLWFSCNHRNPELMACTLLSSNSLIYESQKHWQSREIERFHASVLLPRGIESLGEIFCQPRCRRVNTKQRVKMPVGCIKMQDRMLTTIQLVAFNYSKYANMQLVCLFFNFNSKDVKRM